MFSKTVTSLIVSFLRWLRAYLYLLTYLFYCFVAFGSRHLISFVILIVTGNLYILYSFS